MIEKMWAIIMLPRTPSSERYSATVHLNIPKQQKIPMENTTTAVRPNHSRAAKVKRCKYGYKCRAKSCKFRHPDPAAGIPQTLSSESSDTPKSWRFGAECRKVNCKFDHPPSVAAAKATEEQSVPKKKKKACRYGLKCYNAQCKFQHPASGDSLTAASTVPSPTSIPLSVDLENMQKFQKESSSRRRDDLDLDGLLQEQGRLEEDTMQWDQEYLQPFSASSPLCPTVNAPAVDYAPALQQQTESSPHEKTIRPQARRPKDVIINNKRTNVNRKPNAKKSKPKNSKTNDNQHTPTEMNTNNAAPIEPKSNTDTRAPPQSKSSGLRFQTKQTQQHRLAKDHQEQSSNHLKPTPASLHPSASRKARSRHGIGASAITKEKSSKHHAAAKVRHEQPKEQQSPPKVVNVHDDAPEPAPFAAEDEAALRSVMERSEDSGKDDIDILLMSPLDQLREMGFTDTEEAQAVLDKSNGSIKLAVGVLVEVAEAEARERYKEKRKAAKKERIAKERQLKTEAQRFTEEEQFGREELARQEEEAKRLLKATRKAEKTQQSHSGESSSTIGETGETNVCEVNAATVEEDEEQKKQRWREETRLQKERAALKRHQTKKERHEQFLKETEQQSTERALFWTTYIDEETTTVELLLRLCAAEFCRVNPGVDESTILKDENASQILRGECCRAFRELFKDTIPRVVVKGVKQQDLKERTGVINCWEQKKGKFSVWLDTKKGKATQLAYFAPRNLEAVLVSKSTPHKKKQFDPVVTICIGPVYWGKCLLTEIFKSEVGRMKKLDRAFELGSFLTDLMEDRNQNELDAKRREEEERLREEAERQRRARRREKEQRKWEERRAEFRRRKEAYKEYKRQNRGHQSWRGHNGHGPSCRCPECFLEKMFFGGAGGGPEFPFFFQRFGDDEYYDDGDQWDSRFNHMHEEEERQMLQDAADVLGVNVDAPQDEIKRVFRKKALKFHPDKFREDNHEGMTKEECENHFKDLNNAYDCLYGQFE